MNATAKDMIRAAHLYKISHQMIPADINIKQMAESIARYREQDSKEKKPVQSSLTVNPTVPGDDAIMP